MLLRFLPELGFCFMIGGLRATDQCQVWHSIGHLVILGNRAFRRRARSLAPILPDLRGQLLQIANIGS